MQPPVISLKSQTVIQEIDKACSTLGVFVLVDHDIQPKTLERVLHLGNEFFGLPYATKNKYHIKQFGSKCRGYMRTGGECSSEGKATDAKEGLYMGDEHSTEHVMNGAPTFGTNVFPEEEIPEMKNVFLTYHDQMRLLGNRMMRILAMGLGLDEGYIEEKITLHDPVILPRMFRYDKQRAPMTHSAAGQNKGEKIQNLSDQETSDKMQWGIGRHSDCGLWTMILNDSPGLEFQHPELGSWHEVPFVKNGIIMNVGDLLHHLTRGRYISPYHRACGPSTSSFRLTLPFFYHPNWTAKLQQFPIEMAKHDSPIRNKRWSESNIAYVFDGRVEYSDFLTKKLAKVFPVLASQSFGTSLKLAPQQSNGHTLEVKCIDMSVIAKAEEMVKQFYCQHTEIKTSHGWGHIQAVLDHTNKALLSLKQSISSKEKMAIKLAALLHDVDDKKYFPNTQKGKFPNADRILNAVGISSIQNRETYEEIIKMISWVSCSENGNKVPPEVEENGTYHLLIPRWADRLCAVGPNGVVRCYQYNQEVGRPLSSKASPRPLNEEEIWSKYALPSKLEEYIKRGGTSTDMISHYYDKLLHIAKPPKETVRNEYLEEQAKSTSGALVDICLRYGRTGKVDEEYIMQLGAEK